MNGSVLLAAEISNTWSSSTRASSCRLVIVRARFLVRERRVRLAPLLLMVLASEFEREVPINLEEEGSCMCCVAGSFVQDQVQTIYGSCTQPLSLQNSKSIKLFTEKETYISPGTNFSLFNNSSTTTACVSNSPLKWPLRCC